MLASPIIRVRFRVESIHNRQLVLVAIPDHAPAPSSAEPGTYTSMHDHLTRPNGRMVMTADNPLLADLLTIGSEWVADFRKATET